MQKNIRQNLIEDIDVMYDGGDSDAKCCGCIELTCGVKTLGVFSILGALGVLSNLKSISAVPVLATAGILCGIPAFIAAWWFIQWFKEDTKETREKLVKAGWFIILNSVLQCVVQCITVKLVAD